MQVYVGTSGWMYDWNPDGLDWYVSRSGLNAVELNMSFYRFPYQSQILKWRKTGARLSWSIKVHRSITHYYKLSEKSLSIWDRFYNRFEPMLDLIDFFLFQFPPSLGPSNEFMEKLRVFLKYAELDRVLYLYPWILQEYKVSFFPVQTLYILDCMGERLGIPITIL